MPASSSFAFQTFLPHVSIEKTDETVMELILLIFPFFFLPFLCLQKTASESQTNGTLKNCLGIQTNFKELE